MKEALKKDNSKLIKKFKHRNIIINVLIIFITFLALLSILEIILRTTHLFGAKVHWSEPDPILGYRFTPGRKYWFYGENDHPIKGRINSYGWRDKEWSLKKPNGICRIAVLGDSFVEAFQVESERTFLSLAEYQLNKYHNFRYELMNFGRSGFTQTDELLVLKNDVIPFNPDIVVLFFDVENDIDDISRETASNLQRPFINISENGELTIDTTFAKTPEYRIRCYFNLVKQNSALISLIFEKYNLFRGQMRYRRKNILISRRAKTLPVKIIGSLGLCSDNPDPIYLKNYRLNKILIKYMAEFCRERAIRFMLVTMANSAYIPEKEKKYKSIDPTFNTNFFEDDLKNYSKLLKIEYLGLQRIFRNYYEKTGISLHWEHWNYKGHKVVVDSLSKKLKSIICK